MPDAAPDHALPPILPGIGPLAERYDGVVLDLWGVLHDGVAPFPGVLDCLGRLRAAGKRLCILSNAPRRAADIERRTAELGIPRAAYDHLVSSGEEAWQALARRDDPFYRALGRRVFPIGPSRDRSIRDGLDLEPVEPVEAADFILNTGPWGEASVADFEDVLQRGAAARVPMVCVNPDLVVQLGARLYICAGSLAKRYEELGGTVRWHGKPYPSVYERAFALLGIADRRRILAVGDSLRTDIAGANAMGLDAVLIAGGIHAEEFGLAEGALPDRGRLAAAIAASGARPDAVMARLSW